MLIVLCLYCVQCASIYCVSVAVCECARVHPSVRVGYVVSGCVDCGVGVGVLWLVPTGNWTMLLQEGRPGSIHGTLLCDFIPMVYLFRARILCVIGVLQAFVALYYALNAPARAPTSKPATKTD